MTLTQSQQLELFKGAQIIASRKYLLPNGLQVVPEAFNVVYGGYSFIMPNDRITRKATTAFKALLPFYPVFIHPDYWES